MAFARMLLATLLAGVLPNPVAADAAGASPAEGGGGWRQDLPIDLRNRPTLGLASADIVVVEVSNFKCSHCRDFHAQTFPRLRERYIDSGKVQWFVLNASVDAAEEFAKIFAVARCVARQGRYWEILDNLFQVAHRAPSALETLITRSPLIDRGEFELCLRDRTVRNELAGDFAAFAQLKVRGTPTFLIWKQHRDGRRTETAITGVHPWEYYQQAFDKLLKLP